MSIKSFYHHCARNGVERIVFPFHNKDERNFILKELCESGVENTDYMCVQNHPKHCNAIIVYTIDLSYAYALWGVTDYIPIDCLISKTFRETRTIVKIWSKKFDLNKVKQLVGGGNV